MTVNGNDNPISTCSNCHGYAFAGAQLVIEDNTDGSSIIQTILTAAAENLSIVVAKRF